MFFMQSVTLWPISTIFLSGVRDLDACVMIARYPEQPDLHVIAYFKTHLRAIPEEIQSYPDLNIHAHIYLLLLGDSRSIVNGDQLCDLRNIAKERNTLWWKSWNIDWGTAWLGQLTSCPNIAFHSSSCEQPGNQKRDRWYFNRTSIFKRCTYHQFIGNFGRDHSECKYVQGWMIFIDVLSTFSIYYKSWYYHETKWYNWRQNGRSLKPNLIMQKLSKKLYF